MKNYELCPHCEQPSYEDNHCYKCGFKQYGNPEIKTTHNLKCSKCGTEYKLFVFYGEKKRHIQTQARALSMCPDCLIEFEERLAQQVEKDYREKMGLNKLSRKRLDQYYEYLKYIGEEANPCKKGRWFKNDWDSLFKQRVYKIWN